MQLSTVTRFLQHLWLCVSKSKKWNVGFLEWWVPVELVLIAAGCAGFVVKADGFFSNHRLGIAALAVLLLVLGILWHSFTIGDSYHSELSSLRGAGPKVVLECSPEIPGCEEIAPYVKVLRVAATLIDGATHIDQFTPNLSKIRRGNLISHEGEFVQLAFQPAEHHSSGSITLLRKQTRVIDVLFILKTPEGVFRNFLSGARDQQNCFLNREINEILAEPGLYHFTVQCSGVGMDPVSIECAVNITGDRVSSSMRKSEG